MTRSTPAPPIESHEHGDLLKVGGTVMVTHGSARGVTQTSGTITEIGAHPSPYLVLTDPLFDRRLFFTTSIDHIDLAPAPHPGNA